MNIANSALAQALTYGVLTALWAGMGSLTACSADRRAYPGAPLPDQATLPFRACASDDDCTYVQNGCCDCVNGGSELAVNKAEVAAFRAKFLCDGSVPCSLVGRVPACGSGRAYCQAGLCQYAVEP
jgi:hypothetical protein